MKQSFTNLVAQVETSLAAVEHARTDVDRAKAELDASNTDLGRRLAELGEARTALFEAFPDLVPATAPTTAKEYKQVEVDDPDEPPSFGGDIEFRERS